MSRAQRIIDARRAGMTLVELMLAVGLAAILMIALMRLLDTTFTVWTKTEVRRNIVEQASGVAQRMGRDLRALHAGAQGDLCFDWVTYDLDGDGTRERAWPRLRLVRHASAQDVARLTRGTARPAIESGLVEVAWVVLPASKEPDARVEGKLLAGERLLDGPGLSFFDPGFFDAGHAPAAGALDEVSSGLLWLNVQFATQTSIVHDEWQLGPGLAQVSACWDAWRRERPDPHVHRWNDVPAGLPAAAGVPHLPRRVRIELEIERPEDRARRTRLAEALDATGGSVKVENGALLPREEGSFVLVDREWMEVVGVQGDVLQVRRAARASDAVPHGRGELVHHGAGVRTEVAIPLHKEDWDS